MKFLIVFKDSENPPLELDDVEDMNFCENCDTFDFAFLDETFAVIPRENVLFFREIFTYGENTIN